MTVRSAVFRRAARWALAALSASLLMPGDASGQVRWRDLVFTLGGSAERYSGNFSAVTVPVVDSTDRAIAAVGEVAVRGMLQLHSSERRSVLLSVDGGVRQSAAMGFELRDYAPREWVGSTNLQVTQMLGSFGQLVAAGSFESRSVSDRPPMPLFLQPGYGIARASLSVATRSMEGVSVDLTADIEVADYRAFALVPQLDLLDRRGFGVELGARWGSSVSSVRFYGGVRRTEYQHQGSFDPDDPFRRDLTIRTGLDWSHVGRVIAQIGVVGTVNRSNSNRPEYDALSLSALFSTPLPASMNLSLYALITGKSYVQETEFARLVPGEEADNASIAYAQLGRPLATNLDGAIRLGWTRAETDIGNAYYQRFGLSVQFNYRPNGG